MKRKSLLLLFTLTIFSQGTVADESSPQVIIKDFKFVPQEITIKRGQTINWENRETRQYHSVWFETSGEEEPEYLFPEDSYQREFTQTGSFPYRCGPHPKMTGIVHVTK